MSDDKLPRLHKMPEGVTPANPSMFMIHAMRGGVVFSAEAVLLAVKPPAMERR